MQGILMVPALKKIMGLKVAGMMVVGLIMAFSVNASEMEKKGYKGVKDPEFLLKVLQISEQQEEAFLAIMKEQLEQRKAIHQQYESQRKEERHAMEGLHQETIEKISVVLTPEQVEAFKELKRHRRPHHKMHKKQEADKYSHLR